MPFPVQEKIIHVTKSNQSATRVFAGCTRTDVGTGGVDRDALAQRVAGVDEIVLVALEAIHARQMPEHVVERPILIDGLHRV